MILTLALALAEDGDPPDPLAFDRNVAASLAGEQTWCTREQVILPRDGAWCRAVPPDCPGMAARCEAAAASASGKISTGGRGSRKARSRAVAEPLGGGCEGAAVSGGTLAGCGSVGTALPVALALVVVLAGLVAWRRQRGEEEEAPVDDAATVTTGSAETLAPAGPDDVDAALAEAASGRVGPALLRLRALALSRLSDDGTIRLEPGRTDREYARLLSGQLQADFRQLARGIERYRYAQRALDPSMARAALDAGARLARLVLLGVLVGWPAVAQAGATDHRLLESWIVAQELSVAESADFADVAIVDMEDNPAAQWRWATDYAAQGRVAIVVTGDDLSAYAPASADVRELDEQRPVTTEDGVSLVTPYGACGVTGGYAVHARDAEGVPVIAAVTVGGTTEAPQWLYVVCIPGFLDDASLLQPANSNALWQLIQNHGATVAIAPRPDPTLAESFAAAGLWPFLLHFAALVLLFGWWRGRSFAPPRDPVAPSRRDFVEHLRAVARTFARAGASQHVAASYARWTLDRWRRRLRAVDDASLAHAVAQRAGRPVDSVSRLISRARALDPSAGASSDDLLLLEELWKLDRDSRA